MAIVKMKRATFLTLASKGEELLRLIQREGVLHPEHVVQAEELPQVAGLEHRLAMQEQILRDLNSLDAPVPDECEVGESPGFAMVERWMGDYKSLGERAASIEREIKGASPWGEFSPDEVRGLAEEGVTIQLWVAPSDEFDALKIPKGVATQVVGRGRDLRFATVSTGGPVSIEGAAEAELPRKGPSALEGELSGLREEIDAVLVSLCRARAGVEELAAENARSHEEYDFQVTRERAFRDEAVMAFEGWLPADRMDELDRKLADFEVPVAMTARDPNPDETPPVLTRNTWLARVFEPLLHLLGLPKYRGLDPALFFAPFMMLFFGICLGDVGYGVSMLVAAYIMKRFVARRFKQVGPVANMTMLFGLATTAWGALTGSVFGAWPLARSTIPLDISYDGGDPMLLFRISIGLAILHLTIAFMLAAVGAHTLRERLIKLGSIGMLIGGVLFVLKVTVWYWIFLGGVAMVLVFSSDSKNPFKRLGLGLWSLYNHVSLLGDVMSYSRLFGLGIATGAIASVVNMLASGAREAAGGAGVVLAILILIAGHMFNITMGLISALVHPARLHAVEALPKFVELTGEPYRPLSEAV